MKQSETSRLTKFVKTKADQLGFSHCGIAQARKLDEEAPRLEEWLNRNYHGKMGYMENHFDKRMDPTKLVPGAKSVITLIYNYYPKEDLAEKGSYKVAKYAYGKDYHFVIKKKLKSFFKDLKGEAGDLNGRVFVDSAPVHERAWAKESGIGWIGKNTLLLNRSMGSFFFLAEIIVDLELEYDGPIKDYCGSCTKCMEACPTDAIPEPYVVDASKCISYFTIELKDEIPSGYEDRFNDWIFGCDICQDVCPWNRFSRPHQEHAFQPPHELSKWEKKEWEELTEEVFNKVFRNSPLKRAGYKGIKRNVAYIKRENRS